MISHGYSDGDVDTNPTGTPHLNSLIDQRYSRRQALFGGVGAISAAALSMTLAGCGDDDSATGTSTPAPTVVSFGGQGQTSSGKIVSLTGSSANGSVTNPRVTQVSGPPVAIAGANSTNPTFIAPSVATSTPVVFRFTGTDVTGRDLFSETTVMVDPARLDFTAVPKNLNDMVTVPAGYTATVIYRLGDPLNGTVGAFANDGTDTGFANRAGDHHDGMSYFGLSASGNAPDPLNNTRGLLVLNHENITQRYLHPNGPTTTSGVRPTAEVIKEIEAHGISVVEVNRVGGTWSYAPAGALNRRVTPFTPTSINGPVRGSALVLTAYSPNGTAGRGTINNCANGYMPWNTYLACEENWAGYFRRDAGDNARRTAALGARSVTAFNRYGLGMGANDGLRAGNYGWATAAPTAAGNTDITKFNASTVASASATGTGDFRNEPNQYGWVVEIDPFDPAATPRKRTALGRMNHEGAWVGRTIAGVRPAFYMGDDAQNEYIYKFVSTAPWSAADASNANRLAIGDKYLDSGTLYVARFNADGSGVWLPLVFGQGPLTAANASYGFVDQADVLTHSRLAADALGATRMDRPEWTAVNPATGEMYCTLTNNSSRTPAATDVANPRAYTDVKQLTGDQVNADPPVQPGRVTGNANGHIVRLREAGDTSEATSFTWDTYAFGSGADLDPVNVNLSGLDATNDFSSPDGLWFARESNASGRVSPLLWIETDDGAYTDITNCMLLAAMPGVTGDGTTKTITNRTAPATGTGTTGTQTARVGAAPGTKLRRFLVGPKECEITGIDTTPDGRSVFVNIQHPGEDGSLTALTSNWPASQSGAAPGNRPRSATIVITKDDGGVVGL